MKNTLQLGMEHTYRYTVPENKTVPFLYPEDEHFKIMPKVFGTGFMVGLIEITCMQALSKHLEDGEGSVGVHINVSHVAPTPPGMTVEVNAKITEIYGSKVTWEIVAKDQKEIISKGKHQRYVVNWDIFNSRVKEKYNK